MLSSDFEVQKQALFSIGFHVGLNDHKIDIMVNSMTWQPCMVSSHDYPDSNYGYPRLLRKLTVWHRPCEREMGIHGKNMPSSKWSEMEMHLHPFFFFFFFQLEWSCIAWEPTTPVCRCEILRRKTAVHRKTVLSLIWYSQDMKHWRPSPAVMILQGVGIHKSRQGKMIWNEKLRVALSEYARLTPFSNSKTRIPYMKNRSTWAGKAASRPLTTNS